MKHKSPTPSEMNKAHETAETLETLRKKKYAKRHFNRTIKQIDRNIKKRAYNGYTSLYNIKIGNFFLEKEVIQYYRELGYKVTDDWKSNGMTISWSNK